MEPACLTHPPSTRRARLIRLVVLDDNPFVRDAEGLVHPVAALFHRFVETVVSSGPFEPATYLAPIRDQRAGEPPPALRPIDPALLRIVATAPFDGIAGYLRRAPSLVCRNWPVVRDAIAGADLAWVKTPASNAPLAVLACRQARVPRFAWIAGSVRQVVAGQDRRGPGRLGAAAAAVLYDGTTRLLTRTGPSLRLDDAMFTSIVTADEIEATLSAAPARVKQSRGPVRLAWAGRLATEKGVDDLLAAIARLRDGGLETVLEIVGDGPARADLETRAAELGLDGQVQWLGYIGDRGAYLEALRGADLFVLPSRAEGVPKVVVDAMAAGLPIVATAVGAVPDVLGHGERGRLVTPGAPDRLASAIAALAADKRAMDDLRERGLTYAAEHTAEAQARRLVAWLRRTFPGLPWLTPEPAG